MTSTDILPVKRTLPGAAQMVKIAGTAVVLCAALGTGPAPAQEGGGANAPQSSPGDGGGKQTQDASAVMNRDVEFAAPWHGSPGLWRRANVKTLIANVPGKAAGQPVTKAPFAPLPLRPGTDVSALHNAVGTALIAGATTPAGRNLTGVAAGNTGRVMHQMPVPANTGSALRAAAINGTTMGRMAAGAGSIGGPARDHSGINGTLIRPRH